MKRAAGSLARLRAEADGAEGGAGLEELSRRPRHPLTAALVLRPVFQLALRRAEGFARSVLRLLGQALRVPDHTALGRRGRGFAGRQPRATPRGPMHLVIDSTGLP